MSGEDNDEEIFGLTPEEEAQEQAAELKTYFTDNPRFRFIKLIGNGMNGATFHMRLNDPKVPNITDFIVKRAFEEDNAIEQLGEEKNFLRRLRGNKHIVESLDIPNNPLSAHIDEESWMIQEYIPRGDLYTFMQRVREQRPKLPQRLLWSLFLCLIRACIAMAWPEGDETIQPDQKPSGIQHGDLHQSNILLADPPEDGEHTIAPLLKVIDFGQAGPGTLERTAEQENIRAIGEVMHQLIVPVPRRITEEEQSGWPEVEWDGKKFRTFAVQLVPVPEGVDSTMATLVCAAFAVKTDERLTLAVLLEAAQQRVAAPAGDNPEEQNEAISTFWRNIVYNAST
ncbi:kinase-like protein [Hypoxylon sp. FL1150]|nr:kinase-like protein [Hypoxylon sp. FL1150]